MGANIEALADGFVVRGPIRAPRAPPSTRTEIIGSGWRSRWRPPWPRATTLAGAEWVDVSYPGFFEALAGCAGAKVIA